jgi:hypothetical protein
LDALMNSLAQLNGNFRGRGCADLQVEVALELERVETAVAVELGGELLAQDEVDAVGNLQLSQRDQAEARGTHSLTSTGGNGLCSFAGMGAATGDGAAGSGMGVERSGVEASASGATSPPRASMRSVCFRLAPSCMPLPLSDLGAVMLDLCVT